MRTIVAITGAFGAGLALLGSIAAMATGGVGVLSGADQAGPQVARGLGAAGMAVVGLVGALMARSRLRTGTALMAASTAGGMALVPSFYVVGAILLVAAAVIAVRSDPTER